MLQRIGERRGHEGAIYRLLATGAGEFLSVAGDGWLVKWPAQVEAAGKLLARVDGKALLSAASLDEHSFVCGDLNGGLHWLYPRMPEQNKHLAHHQRGIFALQKIEQNLFSAGGDGVLSRWSIKERRVVESLPLSGQSLRCLTYRASDDLLAVGSSDRHVYLLRASTMELLQSWEAHDNSVFCLAFSPLKNRLFSGGRDAHLRAWELGGEQIQPGPSLPAHLSTINDLAYSPDGRFLATASRDKTLKIWQAEDLSLLKVIEPIRDRGHVNSVNAVLWLADRLLLSAGDDRRVLSWALSHE